MTTRAMTSPAMTSRTVAAALLAAAPLLFTAASAETASPTLEKIRARDAIAFGYRESSIPFSYLDGDQKPVGFSDDLCLVIADAVKAELAMPKLDVKWVPVTASTRIPLLQNGTVDVECGSTTNTPERQKQVAFSVATFVSQPRWLVKVASSISDAQGLKGKTVVFTQGSLNNVIGRKINSDDHLGLTIVQAKDQADSLLMLRTGRAAGFFEDDILLAGLKATSGDPDTFAFLPDTYGSFYYYGLMLPRDDVAFKTLVDGTLKREMASGSFTRLYAKWFTKPIPPSGHDLKLPMSDALKARIARPSDATAP